MQYQINKTNYLEVEKLSIGAFEPVTGFMSGEVFDSVVETMRLPDGAPFPLPVVLQVNKETADKAMQSESMELFYQGERVARLIISDVYQRSLPETSQHLYGTKSLDHPGVRFYMGDPDRHWFIGGKIEEFKPGRSAFGSDELSPAEMKQHIAESGWQTVVGFQTRNVPHRAHEYLQRVALELCDGLIVQPLVGRRKKGDYTPEAVVAGYRSLIENFYPAKRVKLSVLTTAMRYAGPREAVFHALIRKNYGCTHFIIGRDHAGVGDYYGKYDAHKLCAEFGSDLGIEVIRLRGTHHCALCDGIVTDKSCPHVEIRPEAITHISGTDMRDMLTGGKMPARHLMRAEIVDAVKGIELFIQEDAE